MIRLSAARNTRLDWWTLYRPVRTENTTIPCLRFQDSLTIFTVVKILACIGGHFFFFLVPAFRAGDC
jgi:hypothetical protein